MPPRFGIQSGEALLCCRQRRFGDAPFGFDPGLCGGGLREGEFGLAEVAVGVVEPGGEHRTALLVGGQRGLAGGQLAL